jgi:uncharacterized protein involved in response to NO
MFQTTPPNSSSEETPSIQKNSPNAFSKWYEAFASQPHQPFFANGLIFFILFMVVLALNYMQLITLQVPLTHFHVYALVFVVFIQFFLGFLFVVFPRFLMQAEIKREAYMGQFKFYFIGSVLFFISMFVSYELNMASAFILWIAQIMSFKTLFDIHTASKMKEKNDTKWVLIAFATGLIANILFILSMVLPYSWAMMFQKVGTNAGFYLFLFMLIFSVAQRMVPFFTSVKVQGYVINKSKALMELVFAFLVLKVILLSFDAPILNLFADVPLLFIFVRELCKWKLPLISVVPIMWVLYVSLYWIPVGFLISIFESLVVLFGSEIIFEKAVIHIFAVGYFITILVGFGTRVVLGHSGRTPMADTITTAMFFIIQAIVIVRAFAAFSISLGWDYVFWINASAIFLIVALIAWSAKYLPILIKLK